MAKSKELECSANIATQDMLSIYNALIKSMSDILAPVALLLIIFSIICAIFYARNWGLFKKYKQITINYFALLLFSTSFVIMNWSKCTNLEFFNNFNGYNILFLAWILLLFLSIVRINIFGVESVNFEVDEKISSIDDEIEKIKKEENEAIKNKGAKPRNNTSNDMEYVKGLIDNAKKGITITDKDDK